MAGRFDARGHQDADRRSDAGLHQPGVEDRRAPAAEGVPFPKPIRVKKGGRISPPSIPEAVAHECEAR